MAGARPSSWICPAESNSLAPVLLPTLATPGHLLQCVNSLGGLRLGQTRIECLACLLTQRLDIARLRAGHRLVAGRPLLRRLGGIVRRADLRIFVRSWPARSGATESGRVNAASARTVAEPPHLYQHALLRAIRGEPRALRCPLSRDASRKRARARARALGSRTRMAPQAWSPLRRRIRPRPASAAPSSGSDAGSGIGVAVSVNFAPTVAPCF